MAERGGKRPSYEDEVRALAAATTDPRSPAARAALTAALGRARSLVAARAARIVREHALEGFDAALTAAFARFVAGGKKADPMCHAKLATIEALDFGESIDPEPFLRATTVVQHDPADSAGGVRARGVLGLARLAHPDFDLVAARLLTDPLPPVRQAALEALSYRGDRAGAALALYKLRLGDDDPLVTLAAMSTLLALAPEFGRATLGALLDGSDDDDGDDAAAAAQRRELAAVALAQSKRDEALALVLVALERATRSDEREPLLRAVGLSRSDRARDVLLAAVAERPAADARVALEALAPRRFEPGLTARVREAAARNDRAELTPLVDELFGD